MTLVTFFDLHSHRRRSGWTSGGRMASAEGGSVPSGVEYGEGCPFSSRLRGLGSVVSSPSRVRGRAPTENGFWRILKATERLFLYLYDKIWGTICISIPRSKFWGDLSPLSSRDLRPCTQHRRSHDFPWGALFFLKKLLTLFSRRCRCRYTA